MGIRKMREDWRARTNRDTDIDMAADSEIDFGVVANLTIVTDAADIQANLLEIQRQLLSSKQSRSWIATAVWLLDLVHLDSVIGKIVMENLRVRETGG